MISWLYGLTVSAKLLWLPLALGLLISCAKSNYLTVGEKAFVIESQGLFVRNGPSTKDRKLVLVPYGQEFSVLEAGPDEKLFDIRSKWYKVQYRGKSGWLWGGLATPQGKAGQIPKATGQCRSLHEYGEKQFKQISVKKSMIPGGANAHMDRSVQVEITEYERGIVGESRQGYESIGLKLKIPGGTVDDGLKIFNDCYCPGVSFDALRRTYISTKTFPKDCGGEGQELKLGFTGKILVLEYSAHE